MSDEQRMSTADNLWARLVRRRAPIDADLPLQLQAIQEQLASLQLAVQALAEQPAHDDQTPSLLEAMAALERQVNKAGREQFKANTLAEGQTAQLTAALDALRQADERREAEIATLREQNRATLAAARLDMARALLPALDGLDEAIRSGTQLLSARKTSNEQAKHKENSASQVDEASVPPARASLGSWFRTLFTTPPPPSSPAPPTAPAPESVQETLYIALESWLNGLTFIRQRLLDILAAEDVRPIIAAGQPFDPQLHMALEAVPASDTLAPGTVAAELRRGYYVGTRVLRHAEVSVAALPANEHGARYEPDHRH